MEIEVQQITSTTTVPTSAVTVPDTILITVVGAVALGLPAGIIVGLLVPRLRSKCLSNKWVCKVGNLV